TTRTTTRVGPGSGRSLRRLGRRMVSPLSRFRASSIGLHPALASRKAVLGGAIRLSEGVSGCSVGCERPPARLHRALEGGIQERLGINYTEEFRGIEPCGSNGGQGKESGDGLRDACA